MSTAASAEGVASTSTLMDEARVEELLSEKLMEGFLLMERACPRCITPLVKQEGKMLDDNNKNRQNNKTINSPIQGVPFCVSCRAHIMHDESDIMRLQRHYRGQALQGRILIDFQKDPDKRNRSLMDDDETVATQASSMYTPSPYSRSDGESHDKMDEGKTRAPPAVLANHSAHSEEESELIRATNSRSSNKGTPPNKTPPHSPQIDFMDTDEIELICSRSLAENSRESPASTMGGRPVRNVMITAISDAESEVAMVVESFDSDEDNKNKESRQDESIAATRDRTLSGRSSVQSNQSQQSKMIVKARTAVTEDSPFSEFNDPATDSSLPILKTPNTTTSAVSADSGVSRRGSESPHDSSWPSFAERKLIATKVLSVKMLQGHKLMQTQCRKCSMPLTDFKGKVSCAVCPILERRAAKTQQADKTSARRQDEKGMQQSKLSVQKKRNQFFEKARNRSMTAAGVGTAAAVGAAAMRISSERERPPVDNKNDDKKQANHRSKLVVKTTDLLSPETETPESGASGTALTKDVTATTTTTGNTTIGKVVAVQNDPNHLVYSIPVVVADQNKTTITNEKEIQPELAKPNSKHLEVATQSDPATDNTAIGNVVAVATTDGNTRSLDQNEPPKEQIPVVNATSLDQNEASDSAPKATGDSTPADDAETVQSNMATRTLKKPAELEGTNAQHTSEATSPVPITLNTVEGEEGKKEETNQSKKPEESEEGTGQSNLEEFGNNKPEPETPVSAKDNTSIVENGASLASPTEAVKPSAAKNLPPNTLVTRGLPFAAAAGATGALMCAGTNDSNSALSSPDSAGKSLFSRASSRPSEASKRLMSGRNLKISRSYLRRSVEQNKNSSSDAKEKAAPLKGKSVRPVMGIEKVTPQPLSSKEETPTDLEQTAVQTRSNAHAEETSDPPTSSSESPDSSEPQTASSEAGLETPSEAPTCSGEAGLETPSENSSKLSSMHSDSTISTKTKVFFKDTGYEAHHGHKQGTPKTEGDGENAPVSMTKDITPKDKAKDPPTVLPNPGNQQDGEAQTEQETQSPRITSAPSDEAESEAGVETTISFHEKNKTLTVDTTDEKESDTDPAVRENPIEENGEDVMTPATMSNGSSPNNPVNDTVQGGDRTPSNERELPRSPFNNPCGISMPLGNELKEAEDEDTNETDPSKALGVMKEKSLPILNEEQQMMEEDSEPSEQLPEISANSSEESNSILDTSNQNPNTTPQPKTYSIFHMPTLPPNPTTLPVSKPKSTLEDFETRRKIASKEIGKRMMNGWILLNSACTTCATPLMTDAGGEHEVCVFCNVTTNTTENQHEDISPAATADLTTTPLSQKREAVDPGSNPLPDQEAMASYSEDGMIQHVEENSESDLSALNTQAIWSSISNKKRDNVGKERQSDPPALQGHTLRRREAQDCEPETQYNNRTISQISPIAALGVVDSKKKQQDPSDGLEENHRLLIRRRDPEETTIRAPDPRDTGTSENNTSNEDSVSHLVADQEGTHSTTADTKNLGIEEQEDSTAFEESDSEVEESETQILKNFDKITLQPKMEQTLEEEKKENEADTVINNTQESDVFTLAIPAGFDVNNEVALRQLIAAAKYGIPLNVDTDHEEEHHHAQREASPGMSAVSPPPAPMGMSSSASTKTETEMVQHLSSFAFSPTLVPKTKSRITPENMGRSRPRKSNHVVSPPRRRTGFTPEQAYQVLSPISAAGVESVHSSSYVYVENELLHSDAHSEVISVPTYSVKATGSDNLKEGEAKSDLVSVHSIRKAAGISFESESLKKAQAGIIPTQSLPEEESEHSAIAENRSMRSSQSITMESKSSAKSAASLMEKNSVHSGNPSVASSVEKKSIHSAADSQEMKNDPSGEHSIHSIGSSVEKIHSATSVGSHSIGSSREKIHSATSMGSHASQSAPALSHGKAIDHNDTSSSQGVSSYDFVSGLSSLSTGVSHLSSGLLQDTSAKSESGVSQQFVGSGSSLASPISIHSSRKTSRQHYRVQRSEISSSEPETIIILDDAIEEEDEEELDPPHENAPLETVPSCDEPASVTSEDIDALLGRIEETQAQLAAAGDEEDSVEKRKMLAELLDRLSAAAAAVEELDDSYTTYTEQSM